jgi:hypothetical protein
MGSAGLEGRQRVTIHENPLPAVSVIFSLVDLELHGAVGPSIMCILELFILILYNKQWNLLIPASL